ncbi:hypothetical protein PtB15_3B433 [Puccinia triticina]|nr:hypothetical protein PtB15_3B433 [Puccinia triticina]
MSAVQPSKALLTNQPMGIILLEDVLEALLREPIYDETDLDEHGHMAMPPPWFVLTDSPSMDQQSACTTNKHHS